MSTNLTLLFEKLEKQWQEVDILIEHAKLNRESNEELYNALCRSISILVVSHLEGFTKDLVKNIIYDLSDGLHFKEMPEAIKRTYCSKYIGFKNDNNKNGYDKTIIKLIDKFEEIDITIEHEIFLFADNKNPKPSIIEKLFKNFGINDIFKYLCKSKLDESFSSTRSELKELLEEIKLYMVTHIMTFPYTISLDEYNLDSTTCNETRTLWQTFLDDINHKRHNIVHGNNFENADDINELEKTKIKIMILQFGLITILAHNVVEKAQINN